MTEYEFIDTLNEYTERVHGMTLRFGKYPGGQSFLDLSWNTGNWHTGSRRLLKKVDFKQEVFDLVKELLDYKNNGPRFMKEI